MVKRKSRLSSSRDMPVAATATAMLCTEIILPMTPAAEFTEAVRTGFRPERVGGDDLQVAEERVGRRVAAGQEHAEPADDGAEEREDDAGARQRQSQRRRHARVVHQDGEPQHQRDRQNRELQLLERVHVHLHDAPGADAEDERRRRARRPDTPCPRRSASSARRRRAYGAGRAVTGGICVIRLWRPGTIRMRLSCPAVFGAERRHEAGQQAVGPPVDRELDVRVADNSTKTTSRRYGHPGHEQLAGASGAAASARSACRLRAAGWSSASRT